MCWSCAADSNTGVAHVGEPHARRQGDRLPIITGAKTEQVPDRRREQASRCTAPTANDRMVVGRSIKLPTIIVAGNGNDTIVGGNGNDQITAGNGNNWINGRGGNDWISVGSGYDIINAARAGSDSRGLRRVGPACDMLYAGGWRETRPSSPAPGHNVVKAPSRQERHQFAKPANPQSSRSRTSPYSTGRRRAGIPSRNRWAAWIRQALEHGQGQATAGSVQLDIGVPIPFRTRAQWRLDNSGTGSRFKFGPTGSSSEFAICWLRVREPGESHVWFRRL